MPLVAYRWLSVSLGSAAILGAAFFSAGGPSRTESAEAPTTAPAPVAGKIRFNRDIRPILSDNCFSCHGPDSANRKAGLRFDREGGLFEAREDGPPVEKGKPLQSPLYLRIVSTEKRELMPPANSHKKLTAAQKELIRQWIEQGAPWEAHWSFIPPTRPALPEVANAGWVKNPIDRFILDGLKHAGLQPAPEADRRTLIRRVTLDLIGLPPTPAEVEAVVNDKAADWYEKYVDKLLASQHYGEHRGRYWLDAARFGDTHGLHFDNYREMWPYRDWVVNALNKNMRFDQFTIEQLAGDLLPNRTIDQQIASGFHRCNITTNEGGSIAAEVEATYARDRVETTSTVWLGLTTGCATCHDHKFDPVSAKEFYQLVAFFKNTTQNVMDGNIPDSPPVIVVPKPEDRERWFALQKENADLQAARAKRQSDAQPAFKTWLEAGEAKAITEPADAKDLQLTLALHEGMGKRVAASRNGQSVELDLDDSVKWGAGSGQSKALHLNDKGTLVVPEAGDFEADQPFTISTWVFLPAKEDSFVVLSKRDTKEKTARGWAIEVGNRIATVRLTGNSDQDRLEARVTNANRLQPGKWSHLLATYDGSKKSRGLVLYVNGKAQPPTPQQTELKGSIRNAAPMRIGFDGKRGLPGGAVHDMRLYGRTLRADEALLVSRWDNLHRLLAKDVKTLSGPERQELLALYLQLKDEAYDKVSDRLVEVEHEQGEIKARSAVTHVMQEKPGVMPKARVLFRGQYDQPRDEVSADVPAAISKFPADAPRNRLGLAQWLMAADNPLTARVTVNRFWQEVFGTGIVRTSEDFGIMGENPVHFELLDWLAVDFRESGWDMKRFFRQLVTSATYRQAAATTADKLKKDPQNRLLSRGPRFRLDAEVLRDSTLAASGLLSKKIGGPSVKPYQPTGIWETVAMSGSNTRFYKPDQGEGLYRRSVYTFWKRAAPPSAMDIFNAPSRENCTVRRERTNTPLQALVTLNDPQFVEAARHLAQRALLEAPNDPQARLDFITLNVLSRPFEPKEREICKIAHDQFHSNFTAKPQEATKLIQTGDSKPDPKVNPVELAAWTMLASQIINLDEALNK